MSTQPLTRIGKYEVTGLLVPSGDPKALREAIEGLLADPRRCAQFGAAARESAAARFSVATEVAGLLLAYAESG